MITINIECWSVYLIVLETIKDNLEKNVKLLHFTIVQNAFRLKILFSELCINKCNQNKFMQLTKKLWKKKYYDT